MSSKNNKMKGNKQLICHRAKQYGWDILPLEEQKNPFMLSFRKDGVRLNIYWTTMTVGTCLDHPKLGKTQLHRRGLNDKGVELVMVNPRLHTGKGYHQRKRDYSDCDATESDIY